MHTDQSWLVIGKSADYQHWSVTGKSADYQQGSKVKLITYLLIPIPTKTEITHLACYVFCLGLKWSQGCSEPGGYLLIFRTWLESTIRLLTYLWTLVDNQLISQQLARPATSTYHFLSSRGPNLFASHIFPCWAFFPISCSSMLNFFACHALPCWTFLHLTFPCWIFLHLTLFYAKLTPNPLFFEIY